MPTNSKMIWVTFQRAGFHFYPNAPEDVAYLQLKHRHLFKFKVSVEVQHANRDIEFHQFLNWLESLFGPTIQMDYKSCEMIADDIYAEIEKRYGPIKTEIDVSEDGECGATCRYNW